MKRVNGMAMTAAAMTAAVFMGCVTQQPVPVEVLVIQEPPAATEPAPAATEPAPAATEPAPAAETPQTVTDTVSVSVTGTAEGALPADIAARLREELTRRGYRFIDGDTPYAGLTVSVSSTVKARLDEWFVFDGQADARITFATAAGTETVDKRFVAQGPRKLGRAEAEKVLAGPLARAIADWLDQNVKGMK